MKYKINEYVVIIYLIVFGILVFTYVDYFNNQEQEKVIIAPKVKKVEPADTSHTFIIEDIVPKKK